MKAIGTLLDGLDDVVEAFAQPVGLAVLEEVQDTKAPPVEHLHVVQLLFSTSPQWWVPCF